MRAVAGSLAGVAVALALPGVAAARTSETSRCCFHASAHVQGSMLVDYGSDPQDPANGRHEMSWEWAAREIVAYFPRGQIDGGKPTPELRPVLRRRSGGYDRLPPKVRYRFAERSSITTQDIGGVHRAPEQPCRPHEAEDGETAVNTPTSVEFASNGWRLGTGGLLPAFEISRSNGNHPAVAPGRVALAVILRRYVTAWDAHCGPSGWTHVPGESHGTDLHPPGLAPWDWVQAAAPRKKQFRRKKRISRTLTWQVNPPLDHDQPPHVTTQRVTATLRFTWFDPDRVRAESRRFLRG